MSKQRAQVAILKLAGAVELCEAQCGTTNYVYYPLLAVVPEILSGETRNINVLRLGSDDKTLLGVAARQLARSVKLYNDKHIENAESEALRGLKMLLKAAEQRRHAAPC